MLLFDCRINIFLEELESLIFFLFLISRAINYARLFTEMACSLLYDVLKTPGEVSIVSVFLSYFCIYQAFCFFLIISFSRLTGYL